MLAACYRWLGMGLLAVTSGCAMCGSCDDEAYPAYGGRWERLDPCFGRVGSAFTPEVGARVPYDTPFSSTPTPTDAQGGTLENRNRPAELPSGSPPREGIPPAESSELTTPTEDAAPAPEPSTLDDNTSSDASVLSHPLRSVR